MDAKELLRLVIQYRFWIVVGVASLFPVIGYFTAAGAISEQAETKIGQIKGAEGRVRNFSGGNIPNDQYKDFTQAKIQTIEEDVNAAWRRLYERQAPLLDWPERVQTEFQEWGRKTPEGVAPNVIDFTIRDYTNAYQDFADEIYLLFDPWDPITGEGIVVAPVKETLLALHPKFDPNNPPSLGKVWELQENLWVRRTVLAVVAAVNQKADATDWDSAPIKQITTLMVGSEAAIDHPSRAKGKASALTDPPDLTPGGAAAAAPPPPPPSGMEGGAEMGMMDMGGMEGYGGMGGATGKNQRVRFIPPEDGSDKYRIYPVYISVMIDQNYMQNFLIELENSPMAIQVREVNWKRPSSRIKPPEKGQSLAGLGGMGGYGEYGMGGGLFGMEGYGMGMDMEMGYQGEMGMGMGYPGQMGQMGMRPGSARPKAARLSHIQKEQEKKTGAAKDQAAKEQEMEKVEIYDPYYNIVELQVFCQARFYNPPPLPGESPETETLSPGDMLGEEDVPLDDPTALDDPDMTDDLADPADDLADPADDPEMIADPAPAPEAEATDPLPGAEVIEEPQPPSSELPAEAEGTGPEEQPDDPAEEPAGTDAPDPVDPSEEGSPDSR